MNLHHKIYVIKTYERNIEIYKTKNAGNDSG